MRLLDVELDAYGFILCLLPYIYAYGSYCGEEVHHTQSYSITRPLLALGFFFFLVR